MNFESDPLKSHIHKCLSTKIENLEYLPEFSNLFLANKSITFESFQKDKKKSSFERIAK